jgi:hypothetical protein
MAKSKKDFKVRYSGGVRLKISHKKLPKTLGDFKVLYGKVFNVARRMSRQELVLFWLSLSANRVSEKKFNYFLTLSSKYSKEDILGFIDEVDKKDGEKFLKRYSERIQ